MVVTIATLLWSVFGCFSQALTANRGIGLSELRCIDLECIISFLLVSFGTQAF